MRTQQLRRSQSINTAFWIGLPAYSLLVIGSTFLPVNNFTAIWPAPAILAAVFILSRFSSWKWILLIAFLDSAVPAVWFGFSPRSFLSVPEAVVIAYLIQRSCPTSLNFADSSTLLLFLTRAAAPSCAASAVFAYLSPGNQHADLNAAVSWFIGHSLGSAIAVPTMSTLLRPRRFRSFQRPVWELILSCMIVAAYVAVVFGSHNPLMPLLVFPTAMFIAFRYGPVGVSAVSVVILSLALVRIYTNAFWPTKLTYDGVQWVQLFVAVVFLTSLPAAGALASQHRFRRLLARRTQTAQLARRKADTAALAKGEFLANMSHEIRTPLNGVIGLADALSRTHLSDQQCEMLRMIQSSGKALNGLLSDALDLARTDSGALKICAEPFALREAIGDACYLFQSIAQAKSVGFYVEFDIQHTGPVLGDSLRIRQIVSNLISNAVKFTSVGQVKILVQLLPLTETDGNLKVIVQDTGPGFDDATRARLFNRFEQGDGRVTRQFGGTGLGLHISRRLSDMMHATIECQSVLNKGACFTFNMRIPLLDAASHTPTVASSLLLPIEGERRMRVLVAEDHPINQRVIQAILGDSFDLTVVNDGQAALEIHAIETFDAVLMDSQMPVMDGLAAIRAIREREASSGARRLPIISLTADAFPQQVQTALAAGADWHLAKPITADSLLSALASTMQRDAALSIEA